LASFKLKCVIPKVKTIEVSLNIDREFETSTAEIYV